LPKLTINGSDISVEKGTTVLQACELVGAEVPRFCYHERLSIAGNCRMCLVELEKSPKPIASCAMEVADGMVVHTDTPLVKNAREGVMEFLLINHPLDCPICDQGGECDLQDQSITYGAGLGRFTEKKRAVDDKDIGPLIKTIMTRCIHCTRCIRFATEVAGVEEFGATGRGEHMEIGTYVEAAVTSELSGNMIDLCPVGALTSKPYAFNARPWELRKCESIDVHDAVGANIRIDARGADVMRVLPRRNDDVNEEWITDKTRFSYDGLSMQRLDTPYVRRGGVLKKASWEEAFGVVASRIKNMPGDRIGAVIGDLVDAESMVALKDLFHSLASPHIDCRQDGSKVGKGVRAGYLFNTTIAGIEHADACLLVGTNPRMEAPLINSRLRKRYLMGGFPIGVVGASEDLTYDVEWLGDGPDALASIVDGAHPFFEVLQRATNPMLIVGPGALAREDGEAVLGTTAKIAELTGMVREDWVGFNVLHSAAGRVAGLELGLLPGPGGQDVNGILNCAAEGRINIVYLLGADEIPMERLGSAFVVYQGHHGDSGANRADVIFPGAAYTEKEGTYINTEGRVQRTRKVLFPPGLGREDWTIIRALSDTLGHKLPYNNVGQLRDRMCAIAPQLSVLGSVDPAKWGEVGFSGPMRREPFAETVKDYFLTNAICRASITMADCSALKGSREAMAAK